MVGKNQHTILITGGARRIGLALAEFFARNDWFVIIHYNQSDTDAQTFCQRFPQNSASFKANLRIEKETAALIPKANELWGPLDCLINNASAFHYDEAYTLSRDSWDNHMETNLRAPFVLSQAFANQPVLRPNANIINILDQRVWKLTHHFMSYTLSKFGLWKLTQTLALAFAPKIRVNGIGPGPTLKSTHQTDQHFKDQCNRVPLKRGPSLDEICQAAYFIIHQPSMTGQMIALDGGEHLGHTSPENDEVSYG